MFKTMMQLLASMKTAIALFIALGVVASFGTLIPQGFSSDRYLSEYGPTQGKIILALGLDNIYHTWWFIALGLVLILSLLICTFRRIKAVRTSRGLGSIVLHLSLVLIVVGAGVSGLFGFDDTVKLAIGEEKTFQDGALANYRLSVEDFNISFYDNGAPSQYDTKLTLSEPNNITYHETIWVNNPYNRDHITIYQHSYGWETKGSYERDGNKQDFSLKDQGDLTTEGSPYHLMTIFVPNYDEHGGSFDSLSPEPKNPVLVVGLVDGESVYDMAILRPGGSEKLGDGTVYFEGFSPYTGLHIKKDYGIPFVYAGFILLLLGMALRYLPNVFNKGRKG